MAEVDAVLGNGEKLNPASYAGAMERVRVNDIMAVRQTAPQMVDCFENQTRAFLQVQNGCDHRCTFCIIPYARGNSRSVGMGAVVEEARRPVEAGLAEIVLTGVDLTSYGADLPGAPGLGELAAKLLRLVPGLKRLRLSSLDSIEADDTLLRLIGDEERLMPHFHLSAQSGDDMILKRMKRRHSRADTIAFCEAVRRLRPEAAFSADIIVGFPTETDAMFRNSLALVDDAGLSDLHVFSFSPRKGTPAARMPRLDGGIVAERSALLRRKAQAARHARLDALAGTTQDILLEKGGIGRTRCFAPVAHEGPRGAIVPVRITRRDGDRLLAVSP
jgi:threonylcarbamoyladenosine tRNA methylthiotransferase MtaB